MKLKEKAICSECGNEFIKKHYNSSVCGIICSKKKFYRIHPEKTKEYWKTYYQKKKGEPVKMICSECGNEFIKKCHNATTCGRRCSLNKYSRIHKEKIKVLQRENYQRNKEKGIPNYYQTEKGKKGNLRRSKKYRLIHWDTLLEYKNKKNKEYMAKNKEKYGTTISPERMKRTVKAHRVIQRLSRQSIKGRSTPSNIITQVDIDALEKDIIELNEIKNKLLIRLTK